MSGLVAITNAVIFDGVNADLIDGGTVVIEDDRIVEVGRMPPPADVSHRCAAGGRFLMAGGRPVRNPLV